MPGLLFIDTRGPITPKNMSDNLTTIAGLGCDFTRIHSHGFRIGRATDWAQEGYSALQIRAMGRWFSDAFLRYI